MDLMQKLMDNDYYVEEPKLFGDSRVYKAKKGDEFAYFIANNKRLAKVVVPKNEFLNCYVKHIEEDELNIVQENPLADGEIEKCKEIPLWIKENAQIFNVALKKGYDKYYIWSPGPWESDIDQPTPEEFEYYAPDRVRCYDIYELAVNVTKNFMPLYEFRGKDGGDNELLRWRCCVSTELLGVNGDVNRLLKKASADFYKHNLVYVPKRDVVQIDAPENYKEAIHKCLEDLVPHF